LEEELTYPKELDMFRSVRPRSSHPYPHKVHCKESVLENESVLRNSLAKLRVLGEDKKKYRLLIVFYFRHRIGNKLTHTRASSSSRLLPTVVSPRVLIYSEYRQNFAFFVV